MDTVTIHEIKADWQEAGLPGKPYFRAEDDSWRWQPVKLDELLRDPEGKLILCRECFQSRRSLTAYFGKTVHVVRFFTKGDPKMHPVETERYPKVGFVALWRLSTLQRAAVASLAWLFDTHIAPIPVKDNYTLPKDLNPDLVERRVIAHRGFTSEKKALMAVDIIRDQFSVEGRVFEDGGGWHVDIPDSEEIDDMERMLRLNAIVELLYFFDIHPSSERGMFGDPLNIEESRIEMKRLDAKASRLQRLENRIGMLLAAIGANNPAADAGPMHARKNAQAQRIEDGINAILAHLGHPAADPMQTLAADVKAKPRAPAKSSPKSSKRSA